MDTATLSRRELEPKPDGMPAPLRTPVADARMRQLGAATVHGSGETQWWFDARRAFPADVLRAAELASCSHIVLDFAGHTDVNTGKQKVVWVDSVGQLASLEEGAWVFTREETIRQAALTTARKAGLLIEVEDLEKEFPHCVAVCERGDDFVVIDIAHATYIPYELLLAKAEKHRTKILRQVPIKGLQDIVDDVNQSLNAFATMEQGIAVLFTSRNVKEIESLTRTLAHRQAGTLKLVRARVDEVQHTGLGHRVCVDTTSLMTPEEGMIVGSTGWGGLFVCSETHHLPHMNLREFRVNAGAVHSYVWGPNSTATYLSEMEGGAEVLCVDIQGHTRVVSVGRSKIERRPMLKVRCSVALEDVPEELRALAEANLAAQARVTPKGERIAQYDGRIQINTFLQNDWHVRLMGADGKVRHCTLLVPGDELLAHVDIPGRHTGLRVNEHIKEK